MLTAAEQRTFECIKAYIKEHGQSPTAAELATMMDLQSRGVVHRYLKALVRKEKIKMTPQRWRNIEVIEEVDPWHLVGSIPLVGTIAAGLPIEAIAQEESVEVAQMFIGSGRYALRVKGDSMIDEGIFDGDIVICQMSDTARNGQIVVALVDNEQATLKKIYYHPDQTVTLVAANEAFEPQRYLASQVKIQGLFIGLLRMAC